MTQREKRGEGPETVVVNMLDLDQLGSVVQKQAQWFLHTSILSCSIHPSGQNLTQSAKTESDPGWFCTIIWFRTSVEEQESRTHTHTHTQSQKVGNWQQADCILPEPSLMILAHWLASRPDAFGQNLTRPSRLDPGLFCTL